MTKIGFTRPEDRLDAGRKACARLGIECICAPSLEIVHGSPETFSKVKEILHECMAYFVVFSSTSAIEECVREFGNDMLHAYLDQTNVACTGEKTASSLEKLTGRKCDVIPETYSGMGVAEEIKDEVYGKMVLILRSESAENGMTDVLDKAGAYIVDARVYGTKPAPIGPMHKELFSGIASGTVDAMVFANSESVKILFEQMCESYGTDLTRKYLSDTFNIAMGEPTKKAAEELGIPIDAIPEKPTFEGMLQLAADMLKNTD